MNSSVTALDPYTRRISVESGETLEYDYVVIATGPRLAFDLIPGLGPHGGYTHSVCSGSHALTARDAWRRFLDHPGDLVCGDCAGGGVPGASLRVCADGRLDSPPQRAAAQSIPDPGDPRTLCWTLRGQRGQKCPAVDRSPTPQTGH